MSQQNYDYYQLSIASLQSQLSTFEQNLYEMNLDLDPDSLTSIKATATMLLQDLLQQDSSPDDSEILARLRISAENLQTGTETVEALYAHTISEIASESSPELSSNIESEKEAAIDESPDKPEEEDFIEKTRPEQEKEACAESEEKETVTTPAPSQEEKKEAAESEKEAAITASSSSQVEEEEKEAASAPIKKGVESSGPMQLRVKLFKALKRERLETLNEWSRLSLKIADQLFSIDKSISPSSPECKPFRHLSLRELDRRVSELDCTAWQRDLLMTDCMNLADELSAPELAPLGPDSDDPDTPRTGDPQVAPALAELIIARRQLQKIQALVQEQNARRKQIKQYKDAYFALAAVREVKRAEEARYAYRARPAYA